MKIQNILIVSIIIMTLFSISSIPLISAEANITGTIDTFEFETSNGMTPTSIKVNDSAGGSIYAVFYEGLLGDGFVSTYEILNDGSIVTPLIDTFEFDTAFTTSPSAIKYSGDIYLVGYKGAGGDGFAKTINISEDGTIIGTLDTFEVEETDLNEANVFFIDQANGIIGFTSAQFTTDGILGTGNASSNGTINRISRLVFNDTQANFVDSINVSSSVVLVSYQADVGGDNFGGHVQTISIFPNGTANDTIDLKVLDAGEGDHPTITYLNNNLYAIAYKGVGGVGNIATYNVFANGSISDKLDSVTFGSANFPNGIKITDNLLGIVFEDGSGQGQFIIREIFDNGSISTQTVSSFIFDTVAERSELLKFSDDIYIITYDGLGGDGFITTVNVTVDVCFENWILNSTACNILDNRTIEYFDANSCGTFDDLPADNGTIEFCDFCSEPFQCSLFDDSCGAGASTLNCLATETQNPSCCATTNLTSDCFFQGNLSSFEFICGVLDLTLVVPTFPYVDFNVTFPMELIFTQNNITVNITDFVLNLTDPQGNTSEFNFVVDEFTQTYKLNLLFVEEGDFPFRIFALSPFDNIPEITGTLIVRKPYFITFRAFEEKNSRFFGRSNIGAYKNKFAVLTAELGRTKKIRFDPILEHYITPLFFSTSFNTPLFSAPYDNGEAVLKLWETGEYGFRLLDAREIEFNGVFVVPNVTDTYGLNAFVGVFTFNGTDETVEVFFDEKDTNQYRWLFNIIFVIALVLIIGTSVFLFFVIPEHANISILFGLGFTTMLILFRIFMFIWRGW